MGVSDDEIISLQGFAGIANTTAEAMASLGIEQAVAAMAALRAAQNVDIDSAGKLTRRRGYSRVHAGAECRGLFSHDELDFGLFAQGTSLMRVRDGVVEAIDSVAATATPSYCVVNGAVIWTDGARIRTVSGSGEPGDFWCEQPAGVPQCAGYSAGGLDAGEYLVTITFTDLQGRESGAPAAVTVDVQQGGGIALSNIPQPSDPETAVNIYVSHANGEELYAATRLGWGVSSLIVGAGYRGRALETHFMQPLPAGKLIAYSHGRVFTVSTDPLRGDVLWWSEPLRHGLRASANGIGFKSVSMLLPVGQGASAVMFIGSNKRIYFVAGPNPDAWEKRLARGTGVVEGTAVTAPGSFFGIETTEPVGYWLADDGVFCLGLPGGIVQPFSERQFVADNADIGASLIRQVNGIRQVITTANAGSANRFRVRDAVSVSVFRNGVEI